MTEQAKEPDGTKQFIGKIVEKYTILIRDLYSKQNKDDPKKN